MGPLEGVKIVDMTSVLMGPYATQMLGDYGADVIKVESPDGDVTRQIGPTRHPGMGPVFLNTNRSKRSVCLDLKKPAGREAVLRLIAQADVLVYNVRPQAMARLQLGYDVVAKVNPRLIYAGVFGFGQEGPYAAKPAYDDLIQGATALPALMAQTSDGVPRYVPNALVDRIVGLTGSPAAIAAVEKQYAVYAKKEAPGPNGAYLVGHSQIAYLMDKDGKPITSLPIEKDAAAMVEQLDHWVK